MLLVVGGTGDLGGRVVHLLLAGGHPVRCLMRPGSDDSGVREQGAEVVRGDLTDPPSLARACDGVTTVIATATAIARRLAGEKRLSIRDVDGAGMASLVDAAESAGVDRFVYLSFPGLDSSLGTPLERAKLAVEQRLATSTLRPVIIRADGFQEIHLSALARFDVAAGKAEVIGKGDNPRRWVGTGDMAALVAAVAVEADPPPIITVGGPEAISKNEAAALVSEVTGNRMKVKHMPRPVARLMIRLLDKRNDALASALGAGLHQDLRPSDWDDAPLRERGIEPRSARDFLRTQARSVPPRSHG